MEQVAERVERWVRRIMRAHGSFLDGFRIRGSGAWGAASNLTEKPT